MKRFLKHFKFSSNTYKFQLTNPKLPYNSFPEARDRSKNEATPNKSQKIQNFKILQTIVKFTYLT